jgi:hypothetical protein
MHGKLCFLRCGQNRVYARITPVFLSTPKKIATYIGLYHVNPNPSSKSSACSFNQSNLYQLGESMQVPVFQNLF